MSEKIMPKSGKYKLEYARKAAVEAMMKKKGSREGSPERKMADKLIRPIPCTD